MLLKFPRQSPCGWVRDRLPLVSGGELPWSDRRKVERHLIGCSDCRSRESSQADAMEALGAAASIAPSGFSETGYRSLWPALAKQIQEAKHSPAPSTFSWEATTTRLVETWEDLAESFRALIRDSSPLSPRLRPVPMLMTALVLVSVSVMSVGTWVRRQETVAKREIAAAARPVLDPTSVVTARLRPSALPVGDSNLVRNEGSSATKSERVGNGPSRVNYDLDHGTPMGPNSRDLKPSY